jgi:putative flippase GtrA
MVQKILGNALVRYVLAGGLSYVVELSCLLALHKAGGLSVEQATAVAFWIGLSVSFLLQKLFAFQDYQKTLKTISKQLTAYGVLVGVNYLFTLAVVALFPDSWIIISRTLALIITTGWNYLVYQYIFGTKKTDHKALKATLKQCLSLKNKYCNTALLTLPILAFSYQLLASGNNIIPGDPDYYFQQYEAFRRSVLEFHQFPFWNGWIGGGIPLFANIQFGLVSIQAPFVLLFGAVMGMKIAVVGYQIIGFFGFKKLFQEHFKTERFRAICLAYIPVFGSFFTYRVIAGHFTFLMIAFVPWLLLFYLQRSKRYAWIWFGLIASFMIWSAPHYTTIMSMAVVGIWFGYELLFRLCGTLRSKKWHELWAMLKQTALFFAKAGALIAVLTAYRMYFVLSFIKDFPRPESASNESYTGVMRGLYALWGPDQFKNPPQLPSGWGWAEAGTYIGIGTLICLVLVLFVYGRRLMARQESPFSYPIALLLVLFVSFFVLGMGNFSSLAPYTLLNHLPVFDSMRVATRWLMWASLIVLFILAAYKDKRFRIVINIILLVTVAELFLANAHVMGSAYFLKSDQYRPARASFDQQYRYRLPRPTYTPDVAAIYSYDENLYETTRNNFGEVIAGDSLVDTRQPHSTIRCGANQGHCNFISSNARIVFWSPNKVVVQRLAAGPININMNPGKGWRVNGKYAFAQDKITDPSKAFIVTDPSKTIILDYAAKFSPPWFIHQLGM